MGRDEGAIFGGLNGDADEEEEEEEEEEEDGALDELGAGPDDLGWGLEGGAGGAGGPSGSSRGVFTCVAYVLANLLDMMGSLD